MTGGAGKENLPLLFHLFIPQMPPDTTLTPVSRTIGTDQYCDEMISRYAYGRDAVDAAGVPPTGKRVEIGWWAIVRFRDGKWRTNTSIGIRLPC